MGELLDKIKTFVVSVLILVVVSIAAVFLLFGPSEAASYVNWLGSLVSDAKDSGKEFADEVSK